ncbi:hypothetical protein NL676_034225 [Syzygium grande]|nr:hypothetical protein NL676_034225 [Syzygium grande]
MGKGERGNFIKQGATSLEPYREEILLYILNEVQHLLRLYTTESMEKMEGEAGEQAADMETSDRKYAIADVKNVVGIDDCVEAITDSLKMEVNDESMEKLKNAAGQQEADMETSDRNYAIAAVQNVVGIDDRVKQITDLLEMEVNDEVRIIGICGTDGIGKTTLAKAVYNRISACFDSCSFLAEVEETTQNPRSIQFLETKLIRDILERDREDPSFAERIEDFLDIFHEMKVLIVVDDVEEQSHLHAIVGDRLHWFGPGSRIIVTSKNNGILKGYDLEKARNYMVSELDDGQAFELFCKHAFRMQSSIPDYDGFSNCIVNATEKLPLAVEVAGSFLRGKSIQEWEKMEKSMKARTKSSQKTLVGLEEILDICYEALDPKQKHIFLDIAGFISGVDARIASYMWPNCYPSSGCILMPLAKIGENNELQMHRLLRCVGQRILNQKGSGDPIRRKFYIPDMVPKATSREKGMENVEALSIDLNDHDSCKFTAGDFESVPGKTFLKLDNAKVFGDFAGLKELEELCLSDGDPEACRPPSKQPMPESNVKRMIDNQSFSISFPKLRKLELSLSQVIKLKFGLTDIPPRKRLKTLSLPGLSRKEVSELPKTLSVFKLYHSVIEEIEGLEGLEALKKLDISNCKIQNLDGIGQLTSLRSLILSDCDCLSLPDLSNLKSLKVLEIRRCIMIHQIEGLEELTSLEKLNISECPAENSAQVQNALKDVRARSTVT